MAFGFPAYHTGRFSTDPSKSGDLRLAVRETLTRLLWLVKDESYQELVASVGVSPRSWGEKLSIRFLPDQSIFVMSKCVLPTQCFDWGKNKDNVERFMTELRKHV